MRRVLAVLLPACVLATDLGAAPPVAFTRYKYGTWPTPWCCNTIYAQDYDCTGKEIKRSTTGSCYDTGSGSYIYGTCGGGCVTPTCSGTPTKICVVEQANIGCGGCKVFLEPLTPTLPGLAASNCTTHINADNPACAKPNTCMIWPGGQTCYVPWDGADQDLHTGYLCDRRTPQMISNGCRPDCPSILSFTRSADEINTTSGQRVKLTGGVSTTLGGSVSWTLTIAGPGAYRHTIAGAGYSMSAAWNGRDARGKLVNAGDYSFTLSARVDGSTCWSGEATSASMTIKVRRDDQPEPCLAKAER